jgi:hypothetical protein
VCGHLLALHDVSDDAPGCEGCACVVYVDVHLPGQVMLGDGDPVDNWSGGV